MAATRTSKKKQRTRKPARRVPTRKAVEGAIKKLGYKSFDAYLFDRAGKTLANMADELGVPRPSFTAEHRRHMLERAGEADPFSSA